MDLPNRTDHEKEFAAKFAKLSAKHRGELETLLGNPPDISRVPESFWQKVERETNEELAAALLLVMLLAEDTHGWTGDDAQAWARRASTARANEIAALYVDNSKAMLNEASQAWSDKAASGQGVGLGDAQDAADKIFGPNRADRVAVTETTAANSLAGEQSIEATVGKDSADRWITEADEKVCPVCAPLHLTPRTNWERFFPQGPPAHPVCRCYVEYARQPIAFAQVA